MSFYQNCSKHILLSLSLKEKLVEGRCTLHQNVKNTRPILLPAREVLCYIACDIMHVVRTKKLGIASLLDPFLGLTIYVHVCGRGVPTIIEHVMCLINVPTDVCKLLPENHFSSCLAVELCVFSPQAQRVSTNEVRVSLTQIKLGVPRIYI